MSTLYERIYKECEAEHLDQDAIKAICDEHDDYMEKQANLLERADEIMADAVEEIKGLEQRLADVTRNNSIMAEQLKKRDGFWLAPNEPDLEMLASVDDQNEDKYLARGRAIDSYQAMRSNWLGRQK